MTYKILRRTLNWSMGVLILLSFLGFFFSFAGASVSNYFRGALVEVREIEEKGLLRSLPEHTSFIAKDAISFLGNSENIQNYIVSVDKDSNRFFIIFLGFSFLSLVCLFLRLYFRKSKFGNEAHVIWAFKNSK